MGPSTLVKFLVLILSLLHAVDSAPSRRRIHEEDLEELLESAISADSGQDKLQTPMDRDRNVRQDTYNFYSIRPRPNYYRPRPSYEPYDEPYPYRPPYQPYAQPYQPQPYPPYPYPPPTPPSSTTTTMTTTPHPLAPIGYMLVDTYHSPSGATYSKPIAYFRT